MSDKQQKTNKLRIVCSRCNCEIHENEDIWVSERRLWEKRTLTSKRTCLHKFHKECLAFKIASQSAYMTKEQALDYLDKGGSFTYVKATREDFLKGE